MGPELPAARGPYRCPPDTHRSASEAYFSGTPPYTSHLELRYPTEMGRQGCAWLAVTAATVGVRCMREPEPDRRNTALRAMPSPKPSSQKTKPLQEHQCSSDNIRQLEGTRQRPERFFWKPLRCLLRS